MYFPLTHSSYHNSNWVIQQHINTINTGRGAKHLNSAPALTGFTHPHIGIHQWERNEDIPTSGFKKQKMNKSYEGA